MPGSIPTFDFHSPHDDGLAFEIAPIQEKSVLVRQAPIIRRDSFYVIFNITAGSGTYFIDFEAYDIRPGALFFIGKGQVHYWEIDDPLEGYVLLFTEQFLLHGHPQSDFLRNLDVFHRIDTSPVLYLDASHSAMFDALIADLTDEYRNPRPRRAEVIEALFQVFLIRAERLYASLVTQHAFTKLSAPVRHIHDFTRLVDQQYLSTTRVTDYASQLGVTPEHLTDMARQVTGFSAGQLIRNRVILEAKRLLIHTDRTIAEICYELGFDDPSYFARYFKREVGSTPTAFRYAFQEKYQTNPS